MKYLQKIFDAMRSRYTVLGLVVILFSCVIFLRLFDLQIINGVRYVQSSPQARETRRIAELAPRGQIMDRNGLLIASNSKIYALHIIRTGAFSGDGGNSELNRVLLEVCDVLEKNGDTWLSTIAGYLAFADGEPFFARENAEENTAWQKNTLKLGETAVTEDAWELFVYLCSDKMYGIDDAYSNEDAYKILTLRCLIDAGMGAFDTGQSILLARDIKPITIAEMQENGHNLSGVTIVSEPVRMYHDAQYASHVLGYTRAITAEQYEAYKDNGYGVEDTFGQYGVEAQAEAYLHGRNGERRVELFEGGMTESRIDGRPATPGSDVILTLDMNLQRAAIESLERNIGYIREAAFNGYMETDSKVNFHDAEAGAAVAIDVQTGEVLLMASVPGYDPSIFLQPSGDSAAQDAITTHLNDPLKSLWNRAISGTYAPGSTFKPITAITALQEGVIGPHTQIYDAGSINIGGRDLFCLEGGHEWLDLKRALETSCNVFFYDIGEDSGINNLERWANLFGLGVRTGIDLPYESEGRMSSIAFKEAQFGDIWRPADTAQVAIGQLYNAFTPLQMACYMSAFANGGIYYRPYVMKKVVRYDGSIVRETQPELRQLPVDPGNIEAIKEGMIASTTQIDGTATNVFRDFPFAVAGKTGTAETGIESEQTYSSNSLFVCYAPAEAPRIAVVVVIEKGVWGSYAAPVARDILEVYFGLDGAARESDLIENSGSALLP